MRDFVFGKQTQSCAEIPVLCSCKHRDFLQILPGAALSHCRMKQKYTELISPAPGDLESQRLKQVSLEQN